MIRTFNTCKITVYRLNPENLHIEFFDRLDNLTINAVYDYISSVRIDKSEVVFESIIMIKNPTIYYIIELEGDNLSKFYIKLQNKLRI